ncbi:MAG: 4Fe-4S dicluster domain-containing protein [Asgard group archaeon]|nr:4Fe-4S dicluster domain-containing protein [Asgard group archaeon]
MARPKWFIKLLIKSFPMRFLLAKLTRIPGLRYLIDNLLFKDDDIYFIPKDSSINYKSSKTLLIDKKVQAQTDVILPSKIIHDFIDKAKHHWIMNFCLCRTATKCKDYPQDFGCLFLGEAVLNIDPDLGKLVSKEEAHEHVRKCREAGLVHLIGRNKLDSQWLDVRPGSKLLTICNCCECCCLWKMIPNLDVKISRKITKFPGITINVKENCVGCGSCLDVCFVAAISMKDERAFIDQNLCRGCGRCVEVCPNGTIEIIIQDDSYVNTMTNQISNSVNVT